MKHLIAIGLLTLTVSLGYSCELKTKKSPDYLITHARFDTNETEAKNNTVKIALLLDTSNSMDGLINQAKAQLWDIVNKFTHAKCGNERPELQIALYQYGNDGLSSKEGYIQQVLGFSSDLDEISEKLFSLTTNGGEEFCGEVIQTSLKQLNWGKNKDHLKMIFIAGNEAFDQGKLDYKNAVTDAVEKDVVVNTIFCGNYEQGINSFWKNGASLTGGEYIAIDHNRKVVHIETPYDDIIIKLNSKLNKTYISYGLFGASKRQSQVTEDSNAMGMAESIAVKRAVSKSSSMYKNSKWDLVDAVEEEKVAISSLKESDLPKELKGKSDLEIEKYISAKKSERTEIQTAIQEANKKRNAFIATHRTKDSEGALENAMLSAIKKQAEKKNYKWD